MAIFKYRTFIIVGKVNPPKRKAKWNQGKKVGKSHWSKNHERQRKRAEKRTRREEISSYNILLYVNINSNRKSVFLLFSISFSRSSFCVCASSFVFEITAHTEFLHNANNITRNKKDGGKKQEEIFLCWNFLSLIRRALYVNCVNFCLFNFLIFCAELKHEKFLMIYLFVLLHFLSLWI
jgi:hypothetical protein